MRISRARDDHEGLQILLYLLWYHQLFNSLEAKFHCWASTSFWSTYFSNFFNLDNIEVAKQIFFFFLFFYILYYIIFYIYNNHQPQTHFCLFFYFLFFIYFYNNFGTHKVRWNSPKLKAPPIFIEQGSV